MIIKKIARLLYHYIVGNKKNNIVTQQHNNFRLWKGFTLIELMVAIGITAVLGTLGTAGFTNYNQAQVLQTSANEVITMLNLAKSRAQSQIKPSELCSTQNNLLGYTVAIITPLTYRLELNCSNGSNSTVVGYDKRLPGNLSFDANASFFFPVQTGGVLSPGVIIISDGSGRKRYISVSSFGGIGVSSTEPTPAPTSTPTPTFTPIILPTSTPVPTSGAPAPISGATATLAFTNPINANVYSWSYSVYNSQTKAWEGQGPLPVRLIAAFAPHDIDPDLPGVNFLLNIIETTLTVGVGFDTHSYGPYLVTIPDVNGPYTWNSRNGDIDPGSARNIVPNNALITGTVESVSYRTVGCEYCAETNWLGNVRITTVQDIPGSLNIAKYFVGTSISAYMSGVPYMYAYSGASQPTSLLELNRSITGNLSISTMGTGTLNLLHYTSPYPQGTFSGSMTEVKINVTPGWSGWGLCWATGTWEHSCPAHFDWATVFSAAGTPSNFSVAVAGCSIWVSCNMTMGVRYSFVAPPGSYTVAGRYTDWQLYLSMYANSDPTANTTHPWNQWTWRMENWQRL